ncbi:hypothetical protein ACO0FP_24810, partial [Klebsiella pneumoniae]|uniref:hypothetical protein n=1 Tax=Klebsiella pneumoniae TaxID=573 RepID=UPI003BF3FE46
HGACVEQDDKGWDARKRAYCLKIQPATGSFARNLIYSTKPIKNCDRYYDFPRPYPHFALSATRSVPQLSPPPYPPSRIVK